jgi:hypothetical protein
MIERNGDNMLSRRWALRACKSPEIKRKKEEEYIITPKRLNILDNSDTDEIKDITFGKINCNFYSWSLS